MVIEKTSPKISVIMSVFNDQKNIESSVNSILDQTYKNFELLVRDDGSTDQTRKILESIRDERIKIFASSKNIGLTKSLNLLIKKSTGTLIARQDSDDVSLKDRFEIQVNRLISGSYDAVLSRAFLKDSSSLRPNFSYYLPKKFVIKYKNPFKILKKPLYVLNTEDNISSNMTEQQEYYANLVRKNIEL
jgi:glycosyltransferase involved in cell wall biosynthesis